MSSLFAPRLLMGTGWTSATSLPFLRTCLEPRAVREEHMNLADLLRDARDQEPARNQWAILDGETKVLVLACLERTAVVELDGERQLVRHERLDVDAATLNWQKTEMTPRQAFLRNRLSKRRTRT